MPTWAPLIIVLGIYGAMSIATFLTYAWDKRAAERGRRRVPEKRLHLLELLGGWPGGLAAQVVVRHKLRKLSYMAVFWLIVLLHAAAWLLWLRMGHGPPDGAGG